MFDNLQDDNNQGQGDDLGGGTVGKAGSVPVPQNTSPDPKPYGSPLDQANKKENVVPIEPVAPQTPISQPANTGEGIEDMFSDTDSQEKPAIFQPKSMPASMNQIEGMPPAQIDQYTGEQIKAKNKTIVFALMLISLMLVAMLAWYAYRQFFSTDLPNIDTSISEPSVDMTIDEPAAVEDDSRVEPVNDFTGVGSRQVKDSDGDGLSDIEEAEYGTNYLLPDTDGDGLFDREEIKVYKTDPLDTDTDKDGYTDGMEVDGGYNPNGPGNLYNK